MRTYNLAFVLATIATLMASALPQHAPAQQPPSDNATLPEIQSWFTSVVSSQYEAYDQLNTKYRTALSRISDEQTQAANLNGALIVRQETSAFGEGLLFDEAKFRERLSPLPTLRAAQNTYLAERARITASIKTPIINALRDYDKHLENLQNRLTRSQLIDDAQKVSQIRDKVRQNPQAAIAQASEIAANQLAQVLDPSASTTRFTGRLLIVMRGTAKLYHNREEVRFRNVSTVDTHVAGKTEARVFKPGDFIVVQAQSTLVARHLVVAIRSEHGDREIPVKMADWRILGVDLDPTTVTAEMIQKCTTRISNIPVNEPSEKERQELKFRPIKDGGSEWVHLPQRTLHTVGFLITPEMLARQ